MSENMVESKCIKTGFAAREGRIEADTQQTFTRQLQLTFSTIQTHPYTPISSLQFSTMRAFSVILSLAAIAMAAAVPSTGAEAATQDCTCDLPLCPLTEAIPTDCMIQAARTDSERVNLARSSSEGTTSQLSSSAK